MECMSEIAEEGTRPAAMKLGVGSITSIAYEIQKGGRIEERLQLFAKEGGATFVQLNTAEPSSYSILSTQTLGANMVVTDNLWSTTSSTGFSYSPWIRVPYRSSYERMVGVLETLDDCGITDLESSSESCIDGKQVFRGIL